MRGIYTALITPFSDSGIESSLFRKLIERQIEAGTAGIVIAGSTGEGQTLTQSEWKHLIEAAKPYREKIDVMVSCGSSATWDAVEKIKIAQDLGATSVLVASPAYNKPTPAGLIKHFEQVASASQVPVMVYNIPGRTAVNISADVMQKIWSFEKISALKESAGNWGQFLELRAQLPEDKFLFSGDDPLNLAFAVHGAHGSVSVLSNVFPKLVVQLWSHAQSDNWEAARTLFKRVYPLTTQLFSESNPIPVKWAVSYLIGAKMPPRLPLTDLQASHQKALGLLIDELKAQEA